MRSATLLTVCCCISVGFSATCRAGPDQSSVGSYQADVLPQDSEPAWVLASGKADEQIADGKWVVSRPSNFSRTIVFSKRPRFQGQANEVEIAWATTCTNNYSADGLRIIAQGRALRLHPLDRPDGKDVLLTGTPRGMRPDIAEAIIDPGKLPDFDAAKLNVYRIRWVTNEDDTYGFQVSINGRSIGTLHGEPWSEDATHCLSLELRSGTHTIDYIRWKLHQGGQRIKLKPLSHHAQLLLDDHLVERYEGLKRTIHQPEMHPANPVLVPEHPWEYAAALLWGTVIYDDQDKIFKMWYMTWGNDAGGALPGWRTPVCYATSGDGIHWEKPKLRLHKFQYRDPSDLEGPIRECPVNNIVYNDATSEHGMDSPTVIKDLADPDPNFRYKMTYWHRLSTGAGIYQGHSPDGIHWTHIPKMVAETGDRNTFHFDPFRKRWVVVSRPNGSFYELEKFGVFNNSFIRTSIHLEPRDRKDYPDCRLYSCPVINYEGMQIAFPELYSLKINRWITYLAWSHDGLKWRTDPQRVKWMPWNEKPGTFDCWRRNIHNGGVIRRGDKLWIYFSGRSQGKNIEGCPGYLVPSGKPGFDPRGIVGSIGLGILRVDGFCSRDADSVGGFLLTKPLVFHGNRLMLNADIRQGGYIRAGFLDPEGQPVPGFALEESVSLSGDSIAHEVSWNGNNNIGPLAEKPLRLKIELNSADLYSFRLCEP